MHLVLIGKIKKNSSKISDHDMRKVVTLLCGDLIWLTTIRFDQFMQYHSPQVFGRPMTQYGLKKCFADWNNFQQERRQSPNRILMVPGLQPEKNSDYNVLRISEVS